MADLVLNNLELTSMIVQWLKVAALEGAGKEKHSVKPNIPACWKDRFSRLATLNRAFFFGSVEVLWERLDSAIPLFGHALPADRGKKGRLNPILVCLSLV